MLDTGQNVTREGRGVVQGMCVPEARDVVVKIDLNINNQQHGFPRVPSKVSPALTNDSTNRSAGSTEALASHGRINRNRSSTTTGLAGAVNHTIAHRVVIQASKQAPPIEPNKGQERLPHADSSVHCAI